MKGKERGNRPLIDVVQKVSYTEKSHLYRLHFDYKSCISVTKVAFRLQKLRFAYKYLIVNLQNCISAYKVASRFAIQRRRRKHHAKTPCDSQEVAKNIE